MTLGLWVHGCSAGTGGAVEVSWQLRPASSASTDKFVACAPHINGAGEIRQIQLNWSVVAGDAISTGSAHWTCDDFHGATGFVLPPGRADLSLVPICAALPGVEEAPPAPGTYIAPAPVTRDVQAGEVVSLGAVELVVGVTGCKSTGSADPNFGSQACMCCAGAGTCDYKN